MSPHIFWLFALLIIPFPFELLIGPLRIISFVGGVIIIFSDSVVPNIYIWGLLTIFLITCVPYVKRLGRALIYVTAGPDDDDPRREKTFGEIVLGAPFYIIYNLYWLEFANNNEGNWLIYLNYIISSIDIWLIIGYVISSRYLNKKRGYF